MLYRYKIMPKSPLITPLMSDTLFGHFCWAIRYTEGENYLYDFLKLYDRGEPAPVLFSSAFISGYLPRPSLPSPPRKILKEFACRFESEFEGLKKIKAWSKRRFVSTEQWLKLKDNYSDIGLYENISEQEKNCPKIPETDRKDIISEVDMGNVISRITGTVNEEVGGLFVREKTWHNVSSDVYVEAANDDMMKKADWFLTQYLPENGFGADKSVGMGHLSIVQDKEFLSSVYRAENSNACMTLSAASFEDMGNCDAYYRLTVKFGRLGEEFATAGYPFKKPILMYEPGAVFHHVKTLKNKPLLKNIHNRREYQNIRHCGIPITLPFRLNEESYATAAA